MARLFTADDALEAVLTAPTPPYEYGLFLRNATDPGTETRLLTGDGWNLRLQQWNDDGQLGLTAGGADYFGSGVPSPIGLSTWTFVSYAQVTLTLARLRVGTAKHEFTTGSFSPATGFFLIGNAGQGMAGEFAEAFALVGATCSDADAVLLAALKLPACISVAANIVHYWKLNNGSFPEPDDVGSADLTEYNGATSLVTHPSMVACGGGGGSIPVILHHLRQQGMV